MSVTTATTQDWLDTVVAASKELAETALGFDGVEVMGMRETQVPTTGSALIALVGEESSVQIGLTSDNEGCQQIARALLAMEPDEEDLEEADVADAIGEVVNILAGQVKTEMSEKGFSLNLGFPIYVHGYVKKTDGMEMKIADVRMGSIPVSFLVLQNSAVN